MPCSSATIMPSGASSRTLRKNCSVSLRRSRCAVSSSCCASNSSFCDSNSCWDCVSFPVCSSSWRACSCVCASSSSVARLPCRISRLIADHRQQFFEQRLLAPGERAEAGNLQDAEQRLLRHQWQRHRLRGRGRARARFDLDVGGRQVRERDGPCARARTGRPAPRRPRPSRRTRRQRGGRSRQSGADLPDALRTGRTPRSRRRPWAPGQTRAAHRTRRREVAPCSAEVSPNTFDFSQRWPSVASAPRLSTSIERARPPVSSVADVNGTAWA